VERAGGRGRVAAGGPGGGRWGKSVGRWGVGGGGGAIYALVQFAKG